jgi:hypothetical protein
MPVLAPDRAEIEAHLEFLFGDAGDLHDGLIEVAYGIGKPDRARHYRVDELAEAARFAAEVNASGANVYVGAALRKPSIRKNKRTGKGGVLGVGALWADIDELEAVESCTIRTAACPASLTVVTGIEPHPREQLWWRLSESISDPEQIERLLGGIAAAVRGDETVVDAGRVMRLAGTVAWPIKPGRVAELTASVPGANGAIWPGEIIKHYGTATAGNGAAPIGGHKTVTGRVDLSRFDEILAEASKPGRWHKTVLEVVAHLVGRKAPDDLIHAICARLTLPNFSFEQTHADVEVMIQGARAEWGEDTFDRVDEEEEPKPEIVTLDIADLLARSFTPAEDVLGPWLRVKNLAMLFGPRGEGKTFLVLACIIAIAGGKEFLSWAAPKRRKVLLIDGEMPGDVIQDRLRSLLKGTDPQGLKDWLRVITPDSQPAGLILALNRPDDQARIAEQVDWADVIVLDNLACLTGGDENDREAWLPVQGWILRLRTRGKTVLLVHHTGKGGDQRGSSSREDVLDTVVKLKRPPDYDPAQGLRVHWHFVKHRSFFGADTLALEVQLEDLGPLGKHWKWSQLNEDVLMRQVVEMLKDKMSIRDIAEVLDLSKSKVHRLKMRAKSIGLKV